MPLVHASGAYDIKRDGRQPVLVFSQGESVIGLAVDAILDIVEEVLDIQLTDNTPGVLGTAVLKGKSSEIVDVGYFLSKADPAWAEAASHIERKPVRRRVLLVDSHPFFRNMLAPLVKAAGYDVTIAETVEEAHGKLEAGDAFDAVLADADQPDSKGHLQQIASHGGGGRVIPLSSRQDAAFSALGQLVSKSDRNALLAALDAAVRTRGEAA